MSGVVLVLAAVAASCTGSPEENGSREPGGTAGAPDTRPNVVLISVDTLRADRLSLYGHSRPTSPELDAFARDAVVFERFYQNGGGTLPSHMTMMTSLRPAVHGLTTRNPGRLPDARTTLAEHLREAGYTTAAWVDGGWVRGKFGFDQGFDSYDDEAGRFRTILPKAKRWIRHRRDEPFFLFLHTYDVHSQSERLPYSCPGDYPASFIWSDASTFDGCRSGRCATELLKWANSRLEAGELDPEELFSAAELEFVSALYDGCIRYVDYEIGRLIDLLRELGLYDRTLIVVTSDHGEEFLDHGRFLHTQGGYEEMAWVPLVMKLPGSAHAGKRVKHLGAMVDLMPTILGIVGLSPGPEAQGHSLLPSIRDDRSVRSHLTIYAAVRTARWKLLGNRNQLFDLRNDPAETNNLYLQSPRTVARLRAQFQRVHAHDMEFARRLESAAGDAPLTEAEVQELRALGYL